MSTINFSTTEIDEMFSRVLGVLNHNIAGSDLRHVIMHSAAFARAHSYDMRVAPKTGKDLTDTDLIVEKTINKLAWFAFISNQVAYSLRYKENPVFFHPGDKNIPLRYKPCDSKANLFADLCSLEYNMDDGFMPVEYDELFQDIKNHLAAVVARDINSRERQLQEQNADKARQITAMETEIVSLRSAMDKAEKKKGKKSA